MAKYRAKSWVVGSDGAIVPPGSMVELSDVDASAIADAVEAITSDEGAPSGSGEHPKRKDPKAKQAGGGPAT